MHSSYNPKKINNNINKFFLSLKLKCFKVVILGLYVIDSFFIFKVLLAISQEFWYIRTVVYNFGYQKNLIINSKKYLIVLK